MQYRSLAAVVFACAMTLGLDARASEAAGHQLGPSAGNADGSARHDFVLFGGASLRGTDGDSEAAQRESDEQISADLLFDFSYRELRALAEYVMGSEETELERVQVGWQPTPNALVWIGRYHQPSSYWNQKFHHGQYLQTPITRPQVEEWEDAGGLLPQHMIGALFEANWITRGRSAVDLSVGLGAAPALGVEGLKPRSVLHSNDAPRTAAYDLRLDFRPRSDSENSFGLLLSHNEIGVTSALRAIGSADFAHVDQSIFGAYIDWALGRTRALGTAYFVEADFSGSATADSDHFLAAYLQLERSVGQSLTLFGRVENNSRVNTSRYLQFFPDRIKQRLSGGFRWDFVRKQALKFEAAEVTNPTERFMEARLEWSIALP